MLVRMRTMARGPDFKADPRQVLEVAEPRAGELVAGRYAEPADASGPASRRERASSPAAAGRAKR